MAHFPSRPGNAPSGNDIIKSLNGKNGDAVFIKELLSGNMPSFLKQLVPVAVTEGNNTLIYSVTPDYLSIGNDSDYFRVPLGGPDSQRVADAFGCVLPTPKMSDQIWKAAKVKLAPKPLPTDKMTDVGTFDHHNQIIQKQLEDSGHKAGELVAGSKKDVVVSNDLINGRLGIHGLHDQSGKAIQGGGLSKHDSNYKDYSSGTRLVDRAAILNGQRVDLVKDVLQNPEYAYLVNNGVLTNVAYNYKDKPVKPSDKAPEQMVASNTPALPKAETNASGRMQILDRINKFLEKLSV